MIPFGTRKESDRQYFSPVLRKFVRIKQPNILNQKLTYRPFAAVLLALLLANAFVLKEAHHLFAHEHTHGIECEATGADKHYHDAEFDLNDCLVCNFNFSPTEESAKNVLTLNIPTTAVENCFWVKSFIFDLSEFLPGLRGPPVVLA